MLKKIVSGGQTGGDAAGLFAAKAAGLETGGCVPKGWRTDIGACPWLKDYGCYEHPLSSYPPRTVVNVRDSDATVWFGNVSSPGGVLTKETCVTFRRPFWPNPTAEELVALIEESHVETLNVAGNRERINPGIYDRTFALLKAAFTLAAAQHTAEPPSVA